MWTLFPIFRSVRLFILNLNSESPPIKGDRYTQEHNIPNAKKWMLMALLIALFESEATSSQTFFSDTCLAPQVSAKKCMSRQLQWATPNGCFKHEMIWCLSICRGSSKPKLGSRRGPKCREKSPCLFGWNFLPLSFKDLWNGFVPLQKQTNITNAIRSYLFRDMKFQWIRRMFEMKPICRPCPKRRKPRCKRCSTEGLP